MKRYTVQITVTVDAENVSDCYRQMRIAVRQLAKTDATYVDFEDVSHVELCDDCAEVLDAAAICPSAHLHDKI